MSTAQRSTSGCWTCRLRRKKCGEGGLPCRTCKTKGLSCHGYGPKPDWKDRGEKEKEELRKILEKCSRRRRSRTSSVAEGNTLSSLTETHTAPAAVQTPSGGSDSPSFIELPDLSALIPQPASTSLSTDMFDFLELPSDSWVFDEGPASFDSGYDSSINPADTNEMFQIENQELPRQHYSFPPGHMPYVPEQTESEKRDAEASANMTMSYISDTFPSQFPLYCGRRGWLLNLLRSSQRYLNISLSMSAFQQHLLYCESNDRKASATAFQAYESYRQQAGTTLSQVDDATDQVLIDDFVCSMQLASLETFTGNTQSWRQHFEAACITFQKSGEAILSGRLLQRPDLQLYGSSLLLADVLSATSTPHETGAPRFQLYRDLIAKGQIDLGNDLGCEDWAILAVMDVVELERWKHNEEVMSNLSIRELVKRADVIESKICQELQNTKDSTAHPGSRPVSRHGQPSRLARVTAIFANAALVYLNTVISGAKPSVPEVQSAVARAVTTWQSLGNVCDLHILKWPYCMTASLATTSERNALQSMLSTASVEQQAFWNLRQLQSVVDECWRSMDSHDGASNSSCDWRDAAQKLAVKVYWV